jgi:hypothetical protein
VSTGHFVKHNCVHDCEQYHYLNYPNKLHSNYHYYHKQNDDYVLQCHSYRYSRDGTNDTSIDTYWQITGFRVGIAFISVLGF